MNPTTQRARAARDTRRRVIDAAHRLFLEQGFPATTIREVADRAGVSAETVYKGFGGKAGLLKAAYDVAMAGDDEPIPIVDRPQVKAVQAATNPIASAAAYADLAEMLVGRAGPLTRVVLAGRGASTDVEEFVETTDKERLIGAGGVVAHWAAKGWLRPGLSTERARDVVWMLTSPAVYVMSIDRGWTTRDYRDWLAGAVLSLVLSDVSG
ncbi:MAG TPA: helix-turn-helix domain-containing protein [Lapillicoccus sp.]